MKHRLYVPGPIQSGKRVLDPDASHYLVRVLRLRAGDPLACFDGSGAEWAATVLEPDPRACRLEVAQASRTLPAPEPVVRLLAAVLKGDAMDRVVQKATELGVTRISPVWTERSAGRLAGGRARRKLDHWQGVARSASEQSGRVYLPAIDPPLPLDRAATGHGGLALLFDPEGPPLPDTLPVQAVTLATGPEGGFDPAEVQALTDAGWRQYGLGNLTLRADTAPIAALAAVYHAMGRWPEC